jgi:hypothetical protein
VILYLYTILIVSNLILTHDMYRSPDPHFKFCIRVILSSCLQLLRPYLHTEGQRFFNPACEDDQLPLGGEVQDVLYAVESAASVEQDLVKEHCATLCTLFVSLSIVVNSTTTYPGTDQAKGSSAQDPYEFGCAPQCWRDGCPRREVIHP